MDKVFFLLWNLHIILESLPISSSSHVALINTALSRYRKKPSLTFDTTTEHAMHIPTALILFVLLSVYGFQTYHTWTNDQILMWLGSALIANMITGCFYLAFKSWGKPSFPLKVGFLISALSLLSVYFLSNGSETVQWHHAPFIGLAQAVALLPGISRLAVTCVTALWLGINPLSAFIFSLFIELLLILTALLKIVIDGNKFYLKIRPKEALILAINSVISYIILQGVGSTFENKNVVWFGWYLLLLACFIESNTEKKSIS